MTLLPGPIKFFFDGPFIWRENVNMLEFTFTKVSLGLGQGLADIARHVIGSRGRL